MVGDAEHLTMLKKLAPTNHFLDQAHFLEDLLFFVFSFDSDHLLNFAPGLDSFHGLLKCAEKMFSNVFRSQYWCNLNFMLATEVFKLILTSSCTQSLL